MSLHVNWSYCPDCAEGEHGDHADDYFDDDVLLRCACACAGGQAPMRWDGDGPTDGLVAWDDPRWAENRVTYRQLDYWTTNGYLFAKEAANPGSGRSRRWTLAEVEVAGLIVRLLAAGLTLATAVKVARGQTDLAPGIRILVDAADPPGGVA